MGPRIEFKRQGGKTVWRRNADPVKLTALIYLKEALLREKYEDCAEFVVIAREFGALPAEIRNVLENPGGVIKFTGNLR